MKPEQKNIAIFSVLLFVAFFSFSFSARAQQDSTKNEFQKEFDDFRKATQQEFDAFKSKNDSIFYSFLLQSWKEYQLMKDERTTLPKPKEQPRADTVAPRINEEIKPLKKRKTMPEDTGRQIRYGLAPDNYKSLKYAKGFSTLSFYGSRFEIKNMHTNPVLDSGEITQKQIALFFKENAGNRELDDAVYLLKTQATAKSYNAWGFLRLLQEASPTYYTNLNERVLFVWLALLKSGYDARVGYNKSDIFLLVDFDVPVYYLPYFIDRDKKYYVAPFPGQSAERKTILTYKGAFPGQLFPVSLVVNKNPAFEPDKATRVVYYKGQKIKISYNQNMFDYYNSYPDCELSVYFPPPPSKTVFKSLGNYFKPQMKEKTQTEQVAILLDFVQMVMPYKTDEDQFGKEKYMFAEETIADPYSDCEDRVILLGHLIQYFTGLESIGLVFPGHVSLAVNLPENIEGSYITYHDSRYYICDPTYLGSRPGMLMPGFENIQPEIINF